MKRCEAALAHARAALNASHTRELEAVTDVETREWVDVEPLREQLANVEAINEQVRWRRERDEADARVRSLTELRDDLTEGIGKLDKVKADGLAAAKFPVPGLGFGDSGVTYQGVPFAQASSAEQIKISLGMAMALNPKLRVLRIVDGSLLDDESMQTVRDMAAEHDFQVWIETVGSSDDPAAVVIEDGRVKP